MVVVAVMAEKGDMLVYISSLDVRTFALNHFRNLILLYQPERASTFIPLSNFKFSYPRLVNFDFS